MVWRGSRKKGMLKLVQLLAQPGRSGHQLHFADGETKSRRTQQLVQDGTGRHSGKCAVRAECGESLQLHVCGVRRQETSRQLGPQGSRTEGGIRPCLHQL